MSDRVRELLIWYVAPFAVGCLLAVALFVCLLAVALFVGHVLAGGHW